MNLFANVHTNYDGGAISAVAQTNVSSAWQQEEEKESGAEEKSEHERKIKRNRFYERNEIE